MSDCVTQPEMEVSPRVDVDDESELSYWCEKFDVMAEELKEAVREIGPMARDLEWHFARKQKIRS